MGVKLVSASGGSVEINPPATASNFTATMPAGTGTVAVNGVSSNIVLGTAVASTSGTSIDFTGIPSWVRRVTVMFSGVSTSGSSALLVQLGAGSVTTSGYLAASGGALNSSTPAVINSTAGFPIFANSASSILHGNMTIASIGSNIWSSSHSVGRSDSAIFLAGGGSVTLSGTLDRVRITTVNGTDTFDAGSINILYE